MNTGATVKSKIKKLGMAGHAHNPSAKETEAETGGAPHFKSKPAQST